MRPDDFLRRSMLYRVLGQRGAVFEQIGDSAIASHFGDSRAETRQARSLGLADLSPLPRTGFKGADTPAWLKAQGIELPGAPNRAVRQGGSVVVAALSWDEHLILSGLSGDGGLCARLDGVWRIDDGQRCYLMPRADSHAWLAITGEHAAAMFCKLCGVDLRLHKFSDGGIAQTSLARLNAIVIRNDFGPMPAFFILADSASAEYLWDCLLDAMDEFKGTPVGFSALQKLAGDQRTTT